MHAEVSPPPHVHSSRVFDVDIYDLPNVQDGYFEAWKTLHAQGIPDLFWTPRNGGHWIATRSKLVSDILARHELFSSRVTIVPKELGEKIHFEPIHVDPPQHRPLRAPLQDGLASPKAVRRIEPRIRQTVVDLIEAFREAGSCDFIKDFAENMPIRVFLDLVDIPIQDAPMLRHWAGMVVRPSPEMLPEQAIAALLDYLRPHVRSRMGSTGEDLLSVAINHPVDGKPLSENQALAVCINVLFAGIDTLVSLFGFIMHFLASSPIHRRELVDHPDRISAAAEEFVRRFPVSWLAREVRTDMEYAGVAMKAGEMILAAATLTGLDDRENPCPMDVDFGRKKRDHATFGKGVHFCPGALLALTEIRITLEEWLKRIPEFEVKPGAVVKFSGGIVGAIESLPLAW